MTVYDKIKRNFIIAFHMTHKVQYKIKHWMDVIIVHTFGGGAITCITLWCALATDILKSLTYFKLYIIEDNGSLTLKLVVCNFIL